MRASYLIAADSARSRVREVLGIRMVGHANLAHRVFITFRADLHPWFADRPPYRCRVEHPEARGGLFPIDGTTSWRFDVGYEPARGERAEDFTPMRCVELIRTAVGVSDLPVEIVARNPWSVSAHVAERYRDGHVFLVGDAVHEMPPLGGLGMNTGIHDAHNLAWKLAGVLHGWAGPGLLDTYEPERLPVGRATTERALDNVVTAVGVRVPGGERAQDATAEQATAAGPRTPHHNEWGLIFGASYDSNAIVPDGTAPAAVADPACDWQAMYGVEADGAVLVRPDGHVAWRARSAQPTPEVELRRVLAAILHTP